jgi:hypothetical protein
MPYMMERSDMVTKRTDELQTGDRVLIGKNLIRTVDRVTDTGYVNRRNVDILAVHYQEPASETWSNGNSGLPDTLWTLA